MKKKEIEIKEFYKNETIEEINKENIELRVQNNKLLNDNFLLTAMNTNLKKEIADLKKELAKYEQHD